MVRIFGEILDVHVDVFDLVSILFGAVFASSVEERVSTRFVDTKFFSF